MKYYPGNDKPGFWKTTHRQLVEASGMDKAMGFFMTFMFLGIPLTLMISGIAGGCV